MKRDFWLGKKVFLTGHTGFKGTWLALWLTRLGASVHGYALAPPTEPNMFSLVGIENDLSHQIADIRDLTTLTRSLQAVAPDIVFHLAAQPIVRDSYSIPVDTYDTNLMGTVNLLEAVRQTGGIQATIIVTSDKCYENRETIWSYRENDAMGGYDPYSSSKACAEIATAAYGRSFFQPQYGNGSIASVRAGNVIGGGDWAKDRLMADLARGLMSGVDVVIRKPRSVRPWQHVLEPLSGYLAVAQHLCDKGPISWDAWNFGPEFDNNQTVQALAELTCRLWGRPNALKIDENPNTPHEAGLLTLDSTKAKIILGWSPRWKFAKSVRHTVDWYQACERGQEMRSFTLEQISTYEAANKVT